MRKTLKKILIIILSFILFNLICKNSYAATDMESIVEIIRNSVAKWYYIMRLIAVAFMLVLLIFIGIKMAISTIAEDKAIYKRMLVDWVVGMILVFSIHYIMIAILSINDDFVALLEKMATAKLQLQEEYEYGLEEDSNNQTAEEVEMTLYETARTRAYSLKLTDGFMGMIVYGALVFYAWKFALIYLRRMINVIILILLAPAVSVSYAFNKVLTGKARVFSTWLSEFIMNVIIQTVHALMYVSFVTTIYLFVMKTFGNIVLAFVIFNFMSKADQILRQIFKISNGMAGKMANTTFGQLRNEIRTTRNAIIGGKITKMGMKATYRVATKPFRKGAEVAFGKYMEKKAARANEEVLVKEYRENGVTKYRELTDEEKEKLTDEEKENNLKMTRKQMEQINKENESYQKYRKYSNLDARIYKMDFLNDENIQKYQENEQLYNDIARLQAFEESGNTLSSEQIEQMDEWKEQIQKNEKKIEDNKLKLQELEEQEKMYQDMFLMREQSDASVRDILKQNIKSLMDYDKYVDEKTGKYKKTKREGEQAGKTKDKKGNDMKSTLWFPHLRKGEKTQGDLFWRKKESSIGKTFWEKAKWDKLLGIEADEKQMLKETAKMWGDSIKGVMTGIAGISVIGANPLLGMGLLADSGLTAIKYKSNRVQRRVRKYQYKNSKMKSKYHFGEFNSNAEEAMAFEAMKQIHNAESRLTRHNMKKRKKIANKIIVGNIKVSSRTWNLKNNREVFGENADNMSKLQSSNYFGKKPSYNAFIEEKLDGMYQKKLREQFKETKKQLVYANTKSLREEYQKKFNEHEEEVEKKAERKNVFSLFMDDYLSKENAFSVNGEVMEISSKNDETDKFMQDIKEIDLEDIERKQKIEKIKSKIESNKIILIKSALIKIYAEKGVTDIQNTRLSMDDIVASKKKLLETLEKTGVIKKGEITLENIAISNETVKNVYEEMVSKQEDTNEELEEVLVKDAYTEYMQKNGVTDVEKLKEEDTKQEIYDIIKMKVMSEDSKKSADVIQKISGQNKAQEEIEISDSMKTKVDTTAKNVKKVNIRNIDLSKMYLLKESQQADDTTEENEDIPVIKLSNLSNTYGSDVDAAEKLKRKIMGKLIEREVNREITNTKNELENIIYAEKDEKIDLEDVYIESRDTEKARSDTQAQLVYLLSQMENQNKEGIKVGLKQSEIGREKKAEIEYFQTKNQKMYENINPNLYENSTTSTTNRTRLTDEQYKKMHERINGPAIDLSELINSIGSTSKKTSNKRGKK